MESLAVREVNEEVGLTLKQENLQNIGVSQVRLLSQKTNEIWWIQNYVYYAEGTEGELTQCDEGDLEFVPISEVKQKPMSLHDRIIFNEKSSSLFIQSIDDDIHNVKQLRISQKRQNQRIYILLPDIRTTPYSVQGIITAETEEIPEEYKPLIKHIPEAQLREYLKTLGISEKVVGTFTGADSPIELDFN